MFHSLDQIWANSLDAMALSDQQGLVIRVNAAYLRLYGYKIHQVLNQDFAVICPAEQRQAAREAYQTIFAAGQPVDMIEARVQCADGTICYVESRVFFVHDGPQRVMLSLIRDVTERHVAIESLHELNHSLEEQVISRTSQLAESIQQLLEEVSQRAKIEQDLQIALRAQQAIVISASCGIITTGLDGMIRAINPAAEQLLGYQADELIGQRSLAELHDPEDLAVRSDDLALRIGVLDPAQRTLHKPGSSNDQPFATECIYRRGDGSRIAVALAPKYAPR
ncbi:MAG: PAS domain-containing protein [Oscillochloridaceae bacterium umkhey_bin13]